MTHSIGFPQRLSEAVLSRLSPWEPDIDVHIEQLGHVLVEMQRHLNAHPEAAHAHGHDAHTAIVPGTAMTDCHLKRELLPQSNDFDARLRFLFQPAEETSEVANWLVTQGLWRASTPSSHYTSIRKDPLDKLDCATMH